MPVRAAACLVACCCGLSAIVGCGGSSSSASLSSQARHATVTTAAASAAITTAAASGASAPTRGVRSRSRASRSSNSYGAIATFGRDASPGNRAAILAALHGYLSALGGGDWPAACGHLTTGIQRQLALLTVHARRLHGHGCAAALGVLLAHTPASVRREQEALGVLAVRTSGNRAVVLYRSGQLPDAAISMFREAGRWKAGVLSAAAAG
jgi:hypothetical protein